MANPKELNQMLANFDDMLSDVLETVREVDSPQDQRAYECWKRLKVLRKHAVKINTALMALGSDAPKNSGVDKRAVIDRGEAASSGEQSDLDARAAGSTSGDAPARHRSIQELALRGDPDLAENAARRLTAEFPDDPNGHATLALVLGRRERHAESAAEIRTAIDLLGTNADKKAAPLYVMLVSQLSELGDEAGATDAAVHAADIDPSKASAAYMLMDVILRPCRVISGRGTRADCREC